MGVRCSRSPEDLHHPSLGTDCDRLLSTSARERCGFILSAYPVLSRASANSRRPAHVAAHRQCGSSCQQCPPHCALTADPSRPLPIGPSWTDCVAGRASCSPVSVSPLSCGLPAVERCRILCSITERELLLLHTSAKHQAPHRREPRAFTSVRSAIGSVAAPSLILWRCDVVEHGHPFMFPCSPISPVFGWSSPQLALKLSSQPPPPLNLRLPSAVARKPCWLTFVLSLKLVASCACQCHCVADVPNVHELY